ncbi:hypothetical protein D9615_010008 [Tricholomella constricta]|uniref:Uncharacterized protein n=1 Tax=Tricholomella constricta TaxID=117010 RepID=A0A8H5GTW4_9AGAR|nr:hypothetical protein D9615_010008 [Tricholomella constricta]
MPGSDRFHGGTSLHFTHVCLPEDGGLHDGHFVPLNAVVTLFVERLPINYDIFFSLTHKAKCDFKISRPSISRPLNWIKAAEIFLQTRSEWNSAIV